MLGTEVVQPRDRLAIVNARAVLVDRVQDDLAVVINGPRIVAITDRENVGSNVDMLDAEGRYLAPGLIDIHTHGAVGASFNSPAPEAFRAITEENVRRGVTGLLATTSTAPVRELVASLEFVREWMRGGHEGARILGAHVEGPYFAPSQAGAQDPDAMRTPDDGSPEQLLAYADVIKIISFAPELPGAVDLARRLTDLGIVAAAGHSAARAEDVEIAVKAGLSHIIHIWSGQSTTVRDGPWRKPGLLEFALANDIVTVEMIADNKHLPKLLMRLAYKCVGPDRLCIISDATSGAGLPEGTRFTTGGFHEHEVCDGVGMTRDRTSFAGSTTLLNEMIPIMRDVVGVPLHEAVRMATTNPARVIGLEGQKGSLTVGSQADLALFEDDFNAWRTMIGGRWAYAR